MAPEAGDAGGAFEGAGAGQYRTEAFGTRSADATEANAAQLWSTTYPAIQDRQLRAGKYWWEARTAGGDAPRRGSTETAAGNAANAVKGAAS
ncbi:hypothetical protein WK68_05885 [Burkholderia ubonensis]|nr:hypothetical protein WK55_29950 [Burkholderia ubonensis]KVT68441.1 hypothetical protein WK54_29305 [Burkholderia ubonensis]KVU46164.1 hypothetical protein WK68_05885 [Burkholderia ubonensis]KVZ51696.1 hypothetical protein WL18_31180 [Burkholderia ubonensis]